MDDSGDSDRRTLLVVIGVLVAVVAIAGAYFVFSDGSGSEGKVNMGLMMPQTGGLSFISEPMINGAEIAATEINEAGGILEGKNVNLVLKDTETSPTASVDVVSTLIDVNNVQVIVGPAGSGSAKAILSKTSSNQVVQIGPSNTSRYFSNCDDNGYYYRTCLSDELQATLMSRLATEENYETASVLVVNNAYGQGFKDVFVREFEESGGEILAEKAFNKGTTTFESTISEVAKNNPDVIVLCCYHKNGGTIIQQAYEMGVMEDSDWLLSEGLEATALADLAGKTSEGEYIVDGMKGLTPSPSGSGYQSFKEKYEEAYGSAPGIYTSYTYDAVAVAALAAQEAGVYKGSEIRKHMASVSNPPGEEVSDLEKAVNLLEQGKEINYQGASSNLNFDNVGDIKAGYYSVWQFDDNNITYGEKLKATL